MIRDAVNRLPNRFRYADLERALPAVSRPTIARALRQLRDEGSIHSSSRDAMQLLGKGLGSSRPAADAPDRRRRR